MVVHKDKRRAAGWKYDKPHTEEERKGLLKKHGKDCFLRPEELKYPICNKEGEPDWPVVVQQRRADAVDKAILDRAQPRAR